MGLDAGTRFGAYEVVEQIGAGGMGEVYRATDTNLKRDAALKMLPQAFLADPDRVARFQREAESLAALNHVNIAQVYGLERAQDGTVIAMELVEGPTLAERIAQGPIPLGDSINIALQVAAALEAAHGSGIVHRDLKPANIKLRPDGTVKVLDFGIATAPETTLATSGRQSPALLTPALTEAGILLGTAAYMSPEQARGRAVDERADIWAFGCVLFEMLTGQPAFEGEDVTTTLARVLERQADVAALPAGIPATVRQTIELCLEKDISRRIADIRDVRLVLDGRFHTEQTTPGAAVSSPTPLWRRLALPAATLAVGIALTGAVAWKLRPLPDREITRFSIELAGPLELLETVALSPDGRRIAYATNDQIYSQRLDQDEATVIPGTEGGNQVFFSADGASIAFYDDNDLKTVGFAGEIPRVVAAIADAPGLVGAWSSDGQLLFGQNGSYGISSVPASGGVPVPFAELGEAGDLDYPAVLPSGEWVLYTQNLNSGGNWSNARIVAQHRTTGELRTVLEGGHFARFLSSGHLVFARNATLHAVAFDPVSVETLGPAVPVVQGVATNEGSGHAAYAVADNGTLIYAPGTAGGGNGGPPRSLVWVDRQGNVEPLPIRPDRYTMARISPDGTRIALVVGSLLPPTDPPPDIYVFDLETENLTQLTFDPAGDDGPVWSREGDRIYFRSYRGDGTGGVYVIPADGGPAELVGYSGTGGLNPLSWSISPDDSTLLLVDAASLDDVNLATLDIDNDDMTSLLLDLEGTLTGPSLSPNGQWLIYSETTATALTEINIRPYPDVQQQRRPVASGAHPVFSADGSEIFMFDGEGVSVVSVDYSPLRVGNVQQLWERQFWYGVGGPAGNFGRAWDADPVNDRFLMITTGTAGDGTAGDAPRPKLNVVLNWSEEVRARVPVP